MFKGVLSSYMRTVGHRDKVEKRILRLLLASELIMLRNTDASRKIRVRNSSVQVIMLQRIALCVKCGSRISQGLNSVTTTQAIMNLLHQYKSKDANELVNQLCLF
jgi:hypothetical protein